MEKSIHRFVLRHARAETMVLIALTLASLPIYYMALDIPKTIMNKAIVGKGMTWPTEIAGIPFHQVGYLFLLCAAFLLAVVFSTGAVTAVFHMGGEMKWWDLPATCSGGGDINLEGLAALALGTGPVETVVMCDAVTWRFLGLSMAGWNALISTALAVFSLLAAKRPKDARAPRN